MAHPTMKFLGVGALVLIGCVGELSTPDTSFTDAGAGDTQRVDRDGGINGGEYGGSSSGELSGPPVFHCDNPDLRGHGRDAMRRLTRDELRWTLEAVVGTEAMQDAAVESAFARIPAEAPGDLVEAFQNKHAVDHVQAMLQLGEALPTAVMASASAREAVFGDCVDAPDRTCAERFLKRGALPILRRPLSPAALDALLADFESRGSTAAALQYLLGRVLQQPSALFHLELPADEDSAGADSAVAICTQGEDSLRTMAWNDESAFFAPVGAAKTGPQEEVVQSGWYVWELSVGHEDQDVEHLTVELSVQGADTEPALFDLSLNDVPLEKGISLGDGVHTLSADVALSAGQPAKVGVYLRNATTTRSVSLRELTLSGVAGAERCAATADQGDASRVAISAPEGTYVVDGWSVASRLAFSLTGQGPDKVLLEAAAAGQLRSLAEAQVHAQRLVATPAARRQFEYLLNSWLGLDGLPHAHAALLDDADIDGAGLTEEARAELLEYALYQVFDASADLGDLLEAPIGFPRSERLAKLYQSERVVDDDLPVALPEGHGGLLLRIAPLLSGQLSSSPILRGVYVRKRLLCDELPSPDFTIVNSRVEEFEAVDRESHTTREAVSEITAEGACPTCHVQINPLGFALEAFGPLGRRREHERVFNAQGELLAEHELDLYVEDANLESGGPETLHGPEDLNRALATSAKARACLAVRLYTQAQLRTESEADHCAIAEIEDALRSGSSVRAALVRAAVNQELFLRKESETRP